MGWKLREKVNKGLRRRVALKLKMLVLNVRTFVLEARTLVFKVRKKIKTRPVRVVACRQQQSLVPSQSHLDKECQLTASIRNFGENCFGTTNALQTQLTLRWVILVPIFIVVIPRSRPSTIAVQNQFL